MDYHTGHVMTLANSIIGVSVLAMPYCFKQCGIVLSILLLLISSIISRLACHFLLKSAITARRKTFEYLAFYIFGSMGKFAIEIGIIGFLIGTCIAFFVVMGDLGPEIISEITGTYTTNTMRTSILMALALFCVLPLGLLRNIDSLNGVSKATIGFYFCLVLKIVFEGIPHIFSGDWYHNVNLWRPAGILQCLPIFTMALFCQTQLIEIYQALQNATLEEMNNLVRIAVNICTWVYIFVGLFGYIAFFQKPFTGNILLSFSPSFMTDVIKIGYVLSVAFSFPLVIFPCRASLYSLLYKEGYPLHEGMSTYIPEGRFKGLTLFIVFISLIIGIMIPNIELVLGLVGSTIGVMICVLFPVTCFICISQKNTNERILAQLMLMIGIFVMVLGTYKNLYSLDNLEPNTVTISSLKNLGQLDVNVDKVVDIIEIDKMKITEKVPTTAKVVNIDNKVIIAERPSTIKVVGNELMEVRHEPPQPIEPIEEVENENPRKDEEKTKEVKGPEETPSKLSDLSRKLINESKNDEVDIEAIKKEDIEEEQQEKENIKEKENNQVMIDKIQEQNDVKLEMEKMINEEKVKAVKVIESIAREAIEKISGGKDDNKIVATAEKQIKENVKLEAREDILKEEKTSIDKQDKIEISGKANDRNVAVKAKPVRPDTFVSDNKEQANSPIKIEMGNKPVGIPNIEVDKAPLTNNPNNSLEQKAKSIINLKSEREISPNQVNEETKPAIGVVIDSPSQKKSEPSIVKLRNDSLQSNSSNVNTNNTAPLFLKLGKSEVKLEENKINKIVPPLPLIMSGNLASNSSQFVGPPVAPNEVLQSKEVKDVNLVSKEDVKVLESDTLQVKSKR